MRTTTIQLEGHIFRWRGGSFVAVWEEANRARLVPDYMLDLPASLNRSKATRADIERVAREFVGLES